jgi:hypothetical protein
VPSKSEVTLLAVGAGVGDCDQTATAIELVVAADPLDVQEMLNVVFCAIGPTVSTPLADFVPDQPPLAVQPVPLEVQVRFAFEFG